MTADEILQAAERRIAEIDALFITLNVERAKLQAMVGRTQAHPVLPLVPTAPRPFVDPWPFPYPPVPEIQPYTPFIPKDDVRFVWMNTQVGAEPVLMDGFAHNLVFRSDASQEAPGYTFS